MELKTFSYLKNTGWSVKPFPDLDSKNTLILVFCSAEYMSNTEPLLELINAFPTSKMIGCSTAGEIFGSSINDNSLCVGIIKFSECEPVLASAEITSFSESKNAGLDIAKKLFRPDLKSVFILSDGLLVNGSELVDGLNSGLPNNVVITGGLAADGDRFKKTWIICDKKPISGRISAVGLYGKNLKIGHGSRGGWDSFGPERIITRSKSNILYELDGKPALKLYKEYLGERAKGLPATGLLFPLMIRKNIEDAPKLVRTILAVDETEQSMTFAGDVPNGWYAKLMRANFDRLITGANEAALTAGKCTTSNGPILAIAISCVGRRLLLGERTEEEIEITLESLPKGTEQIGFYSYGEISPYASGSCDLHNQTMTLTTISEEDS